jgi:hypothetical protein
MKKNILLQTFFYDFLKIQVTNWVREILFTFKKSIVNDESCDRRITHLSDTEISFVLCNISSEFHLYLEVLFAITQIEQESK